MVGEAFTGISWRSGKDRRPDGWRECRPRADQSALSLGADSTGVGRKIEVHARRRVIAGVA
jgi:hypothetical protein